MTMTTISCIVMSLAPIVGIAPKWDAKSLIPALRELDHVLAKNTTAFLAFEDAPKKDAKETISQFRARVRDWQTTSTAYLELVASLQALPLLTASQLWASVAPIKVLPQADGTLKVEATITRPKNKRIRFTTPEEQALFRDWDFKRHHHKEDYDSATANCRAHILGNSFDQVRYRDTCLREASEHYHHDIHVLDIQQKRALADTYATIELRRSSYQTITFVAVAPKEVAAQIDVAKLTRTKRAKILFRLRDLSLLTPIPEADVPSVPNVLYVDLLDVEKRYRIKVP